MWTGFLSEKNKNESPENKDTQGPVQPAVGDPVLAGGLD